MDRFILYVIFGLLLARSGYAEVPPPCCNNIVVTPNTTGHAWEEEPLLEEEKFEKLRPELFYTLDHEQHNFLIRGNNPIDNDQFCRDELVSAIKNYLARKGVTISDNFKIMDLSLLNSFFDSSLIEIEKAWATEHPEQGCLWLNAVYGVMINPTYLPQSARNFILNHHDMDGLKTFMTTLKKIVDAPCPADFVIYLHCRAGKDRTGEAAACYLMQYKNYSYKDAVALNKQIAKRDLRCLSMNAIRWYAFYLRDIEKMSWIGEID
ncbi:MAG: tyrosine-protein phosphatase [Chlamydiales bacterium]